MGDMAIPRSLAGQSDTSTRLAAKFIFRGYTAAVGTQLGGEAIIQVGAIV
jgi:hypothetical protein